MTEKSSKNTKEILKYVAREVISYVPFARLYNVYARNKQLPKDEKKSRWERAKGFLKNNPEAPLFVWDLITTAGLVIGLSNDYQRELFSHGQTTVGSYPPYTFKNPLGSTGLERRALNPLEYPYVQQIVANAAYKTAKKGIEHVKNKSK